MLFDPNQIEQLRTEFQQAQQVLLLTHDYPDGDAIGSCIAVYEMLKQFNVHADVVYTNIDKDHWAFIPGWTSLPVKPPDAIQNTDYDLAVVCDCSDQARINGPVEVLTGIPVVINIDHHFDNTRFGSQNYVFEACSVGEILYDLAIALKCKITANLAYAVVLSIVTDTGRFKHTNTTTDCLQIVSDLMTVIGSKAYQDMMRHLYMEVSMTKMTLMAEALKNMMILDNRIVFSYVEQDCGLEEGLIDQLNTIGGTQGAILIRRVGNQLKMSFRSKDPDFQVQPIALLFNGGGHRYAAGATLPLDNVKSQVQQIRVTIEDYLRRSSHG